ncbi:MAG: DUF222 domain-containing protein, partial [Actinobacteria bacterium]|nr:DUF222 domain-containing protein [Actinomycetota bacterium]
MYEGAGVSGNDATPMPMPTAPTAGPTTESTPVTLDLTGPALAVLEGFTRWVAALPAGVGEGENLGRITALESLKNVCAAVQARETVAFDEARRGGEAGRGVPAKKRCRGVASEIALARRDSPARGSRHLSLARALATDLPHTRAKLTDGKVSEWRASIVLKETESLTPAGRRHVDEQLAPHLSGLGDRRLTRRARALAQAYDPDGAAQRYQQAEKGRFVDIDTASDATVHFSALLPAAQGIAAWKALGSHVNTLISTGQTEGRTHSQMMADTLVERLTGQGTATAVPVEIHLIMTDATLLGGDDAPAWVVGHGPLPAATARHLLDPDSDGPSGKARAWIRRLFTSLEAGHLVAMDSHRRTFDGLLRRMVILRDDTCRTPWCDAPIRHIDHARAHATGGETSYANASGLCERCNQVKENPGWHHAATPEQLTVRTPTG